MAYAQPRSANRELEQGMVDGAYKQVAKDRGGVVEALTPTNLGDLDWKFYGFHEASTMCTPDGQHMTPVYRVDIPAVCSEHER